MRIRNWLSIIFLPLSFPLVAQDMGGEFCFTAPHDQLCPAFPEDVPEFSAFFEYMVISAAAQAPFDRHAWQAFVSLNWDQVGTGGMGWRSFPRRDTVLGRDAATCGAAAEVVVTAIDQSDGNTLIDRNGNFILYEIRMNPVAADYIWRENLHLLSGQMGAEISFPMGRDAAQPATVFLKTAWTILDAPSPDYITARGVVAIPPERSLSGEPLCVEATLGLVGMHIVTKVESGNGDEWVWATFEHRANAPLAADARDINAIYGQNLFPEGCAAPAWVAGDYLFYSAGHPGPANAPPPRAAIWSATAPHAVDAAGAPLPGTQVVRCWEVFAPTQATNARWQDALRGTPLEHYMLISAQWRGANISSYLEHGELPRFLSNVTMETYLQTDRAGTCLGCHASAVTATGGPSDFTFVLRDVYE